MVVEAVRCSLPLLSLFAHLFHYGERESHAAGKAFNDDGAAVVAKSPQLVLLLEPLLLLLRLLLFKFSPSQMWQLAT